MASNVATRVALVTGSTSGLGYGIAKALAGKGHSIILSGLGEANVIERCRDDIASEFNVPVYHIPADISNEYEIRKLSSTINKTHAPGIDILVNNAGFQHVSEIERFPVEVWDRMLAVMLTAPFLLTKYLLPGMKRKGWGRIINIGSAHSTVGSEHKAGYCSDKHGLIGLTKVTALDTAGSGITCNAINPGWIGTEIFWQQVKALAHKEGISEDAAKHKILAKHPSKELTTIGQVGETVNFLCSPAADNITGAALAIDGGWTAT